MLKKPFVRRTKKKKLCAFCVDKINSVDYKDLNKLKKFVTDRGKILPKRISGACSKHQRMLKTSINKARNIAILPFVID